MQNEPIYKLTKVFSFTMKSNKISRSGFGDADTGDLRKRAVKLAPNKKSGKQKHELYRGLNQVDDDDDEDFESYTKRESILDYFDDLDEDE